MRRDNDELVIAVADHGPGIPEVERENVLRHDIGWKFVGKVDAADVTKIPANVLTSVLGAGASDATALAGDRAERPAARREE